MKVIEIRWWHEGVRRILQFDRKPAREFVEKLIRNWEPTIRDWGTGFLVIDAGTDKVHHWDLLKGWQEIDYKKWKERWTQD